MANGLTSKQKAFADHYIETQNASEAARLAGYTSPADSAKQNMNLDKVKEYIKQRKSKIQSSRIMDIEEAVERMSSIARADVQQEVYYEEDRSLAGKVDKDGNPLDPVVKDVIIKRTPSMKDVVHAIEFMVKFNEGLDPYRNKLAEAQLSKVKAEIESIKSKTTLTSKDVEAQVGSALDRINKIIIEYDENEMDDKDKDGDVDAD